MNNNFFSTVYAPVKVSERLPEKDGWYVIKEKVGETSELFYHADNKKWYADSGLYNEIDSPFITDEWLEPLANRYIFTKEELEKQFADLIEAWSEQKVDSKGAAGYAKVLVSNLKSQQ